MEIKGLEVVWVFNGTGGYFPAAVFSTREKAEEWISKTGVSGILTKYPIDFPLYDWAMEKGYFKPKYPSHSEPTFIQRFSSAYLDHHHYENGKSPTENEENAHE